MSAIIHGNIWSTTPNANVERTRFQHVTGWLKEVGGTVNFYQVIEKTLKLAAHVLRSVGNKASFTCDRLANKFVGVYSGLCVTRLPEVVGKAFKTIFCPTERLTTRDSADALNTLGDAGETIGYSGAFLLSNPVFMAVANGFGLNNIVTDIYMKGYDVHKANSLLNEVGDASEAQPVKRMLQDTKKHTLLKLAKSVASLAVTVLGMALLVLRGPVLPAVALLTVSLGGTISGICAYFFKESAPYQLADFSKPPVPASLPV